MLKMMGGAPAGCRRRRVEHDHYWTSLLHTSLTVSDAVKRFRTRDVSVVTPSSLLLVERPALEAGVEDADRAIPEGSERLVVKVTCRPTVVVIDPAAGIGRDAAEGPLVDGFGCTRGGRGRSFSCPRRP